MNKWKCKEATLVAGFGIIRPGSVLEIEDGQETEIVRACFEKLDAGQVKKEQDEKSIDNDLTYAVKLEKLRDMKVKIPRGASKENVDRLFEEFVNKVELPDIVG